ncbi:MAG: PH domain-containing protein [Salinigranum sp.]
MARGRPAVWSAVMGALFVVFGSYLYGTDMGPYSPLVGLPFILFGCFVVLFGLYVHVTAAPAPPRLREDEEIVDTRHPIQRTAQVKIVLGSLLLVAGVYLLFFTYVPYVYPTVTFLLGLYGLSSGLYTYWKNTLTTYYVTNRRLIKEYRLISLRRQEVPFEKVRAVEERRSIPEALVGLGNVRVASGEGPGLAIVVRNVSRSTAFADRIRDLL